MEFDLLSMGKRIEDLGTRALSWRDLSVISRWSDPHTSALFRAVSPEESMWSLSTQLQASTVDLLSRLWWAKTKNAGKASNPMPHPIPRPGFHRQRDTSAMRRGDAMTVEEFDARMAAKFSGPN